MQPTRWKAIDAGLAFLTVVQRSDGSFDSYSSPTQKPFHTHIRYQTTFAPALILGALAAIPNEQAQTIKHALAAWTLTQKSPDWSFNYWTMQSAERTTMPYPDDLDDTFCALIGLHLYDPELTDTACLAKMVRLLIATESQVGGPYRTWLVGKNVPAVWHDVDPAVNSNIAYFLSLVASVPAKLEAYIEQTILSGAYTSPYYPSWHATVYYLARGYRGPSTQQVIRYVLQRRRHGHWGSPLKTALALTTLVRLGYSGNLEPALTYLQSSQLADGSWPAEAFCLDPVQNQQKHYSGSAALTTAFALEALTCFLQPPDAAITKSMTPTPQDAATKKLYTHIMQTARAQMQQLRQPLRSLALSTLEHMDNSGHNQEIVLLPFLFAKSLRTAPRLDSTLLQHLGCANLYGWIAYTIYDDFLDGEGDPKLLSVANVALRYSLANFKAALPNHAAFQRKVLTTFDIIDAANAWEVTCTRALVQGNTVQLPSPLPAYKTALTLSERSLGHMLTPLGVLASQGVDLQSTPAKDIEKAFRHYLCARQLNDDLHDWKPDILAGHCTYVVTTLCAELSLLDASQSLDQLVPAMQQQFWNHSLLPICKTMAHHTAHARQAATHSQLLTESTIITQLTATIDASIRLTHQEHAKATTFLSAYTT